MLLKCGTHRYRLANGPSAPTQPHTRVRSDGTDAVGVHAKSGAARATRVLLFRRPEGG